MLFSFWLRNGRRPALAARRRTQTPLRPRASFQPHLQALEDRCLMSSTIVQTNLVSDNTQVTPARVQDPNLVNPWGLAASPTGPWLVATQGTGTSTVYHTSKTHVSVGHTVVNVPPSSTSSSHGTPTGIVYNSSGKGFDISETGKTGSSAFLFDSVDGTISGWNPKVSSSNAVVEVTNPGAVYLGLALATDGHGKTQLYAANFSRGSIDVYNQSFHLVTTPAGSFTDSQLPADYHPFNIQAINNRLYVEYAPVDKVLAGKADPGDGAIDVYSADGQLQQRLILPGDTHLNDPWAIVMAPAHFGSFSNDLLVGDFGNGHIEAFNPHSGSFVGELDDASGQPIAITHLWGLAFGNGGAAGPTNTLYFTAGLSSNLQGIPPFHGLFGSLQVATHEEGCHGDGQPHGWHDPNALTSAPSFLPSALPTSTLSSPTVRAPAARNADGSLATGEPSSVYFSSSDSTTTPPASYTFTPPDVGVQTLINTVFMPRKGRQSLAVTDTQNSNLTADISIPSV